MALLLAVWQPACAADSTEDKIAQALSGWGTYALVGGAVAMPLIAGHADWETESLRTADAIVCAYALTLLLKELTGQPRPNGEGDDSFPSGHATLAFSAATMAADYSPDEAPWWYGAAALVGWSRVRLNEHRPHEVLAGAALGTGIAELELDRPRGILVAPFIDPDTGATGVQARWEF